MAEMIKLDLGVIGETAQRARSIRRTFDSSDQSAHEAAEAAGHDGLGDAIERFASSWNDRREDFAANLLSLEEALTAIETAFSELDVKLGQSVQISAGE